MTKTDLKLDWCSHEAAKYAVEKWHYSQRMPIGKIIKIGVWESSVFRGVILFARGANQNMATVYNVTQIESCELVRIALTTHKTPISRLVSIAIKMLEKLNPDLRLIISYADPQQSHHGGIYQAGNWVYVGRGQSSVEFFHEGRWKHSREVTSGAFGGARKIVDYSHLPKRNTQGKHKYLYPLDDAMRAQIAPLAKPYPKRDIVPMRLSSSSKTSSDQEGNGGATPTQTLLTSTHEIEF